MGFFAGTDPPWRCAGGQNKSGLNNEISTNGFSEFCLVHANETFGVDNVWYRERCRMNRYALDSTSRSKDFLWG